MSEKDYNEVDDDAVEMADNERNDTDSESELRGRKRSADSDDETLSKRSRVENTSKPMDAAAKLRAIEERKKALEAEQLRKEAEMEALQQEEEALLRDAEGEDADVGNADEYETRSEVASDIEKDEDIANAGVEGSSADGGWDVDIHTTEGERDLSVDSPVHSRADSEAGSDGEKEEEPGETREGSSKKTDAAEAPKSQLIAESMRPRLQKYLYREARYFMVKSNNHENVRLAKAKGVWSTPPQNEIKFNKAVNENTTVILIFSVKESGAFQGYARINGQSNKNGPRISWVLPPGISARALSGVFKIDWISSTACDFKLATHLKNRWNRNKYVKIARDGQEIEPHVGAELCKLFTLDGSTDYERVISRIKRKREMLQKSKPVPSYRTSSSHRGGQGSGSSRGYSNRRDESRSGSSYSSSNRRDSNSRSSASYGRTGGFDGGYRGGVGEVIAKGSYSDYLQEVARSSAGFAIHPMHGYGAYTGHGPPAPVIPGYGSARPSSERYDRAVDDFLKKNSRSSGSARDRRDRR